MSLIFTNSTISKGHLSLEDSELNFGTEAFYEFGISGFPYYYFICVGILRFVAIRRLGIN